MESKLSLSQSKQVGSSLVILDLPAKCNIRKKLNKHIQMYPVCAQLCCKKKKKIPK